MFLLEGCKITIGRLVPEIQMVCNSGIKPSVNIHIHTLGWLQLNIYLPWVWMGLKGNFSLYNTSKVGLRRAETGRG